VRTSLDYWLDLLQQAILKYVIDLPGGRYPSAQRTVTQKYTKRRRSSVATDPVVCVSSGDGYRESVELDGLRQRGEQSDDVSSELCLELVRAPPDDARRRKVVVTHCTIAPTKTTTTRNLSSPIDLQTHLITARP